jgi:hypothetical protein
MTTRPPVRDRSLNDAASADGPTWWAAAQIRASRLQDMDQDQVVGMVCRINAPKLELLGIFS